MDDISLARAQRETDNTKVSPVTLLKMMIQDIETGHLKADGLLICYAYCPTDGPWQSGTYRCGMTREREISTLAIASHRMAAAWLGVS